MRFALSLLLLLYASGSPAHSFGQVYNLPVPFWLYAWGAAAALVVSFVILAIFLASPARATTTGEHDLSHCRLVKVLNAMHLTRVLRVFSVALLGLCIVTGWWGDRNPYGNFNMTFFWIVFALGFAWFCVLFGNFYAQLNPWRAVAGWIGMTWTRYREGFVGYPQWLAYWPALFLYMGFIWIELLANNTPRSLAEALLAYSLLNLLGAGLFGARDWFRYCEFFSVLFRLLSSLSPLRVSDGGGGGFRLHARRPLHAAVESRFEHFSLLLFLLFLLSSTAFDGLHEAAAWYRLYWVDAYRCCLQHVFGSHPLKAYANMRETYAYWQTAWLLVSPLLYLLTYLVFLLASRCFVTNAPGLRQLALHFAPSLLPIAVVYHVSHYFTLIETQGIKIISLASDPFGWGWNLFGTANWLQRNFVPDAAFVWHAQVGLIIAGHVLSVWMAHLIALRVIPDRRQALLSQVPMLLLMVCFTVAGLWILSLPNMAPVER